jgi:hypothetical protein
LVNNSDIFNNSKDIIKKEAVARDFTELGEIQEVGLEYIITQKGIINKDIFYIPKHLVDRFDGIHVWFKITEEEAQQYRKHKKAFTKLIYHKN